MSLIATFDAHPETVFEALLGAAIELGNLVTAVDRKALSLFVGKEGKSYRVAASVVDNGRGRATVHLSSTPPGSTGASKCARRLLKAATRSLESLTPPPPPEPPPPPDAGPTAQ